MQKSNLKAVGASLSEQATLRQTIDEVVAVRREARDLERWERRKMAAEPALTLACKQAGGIDRDRLAELDQLFRSLPATQEYSAIHRFVVVIKERAAKVVGGDLCPPASNLCARELYMELLGAGLNTRTSALEWVALAWLHATREAPEAFREGCADPAAHEARIAALHAREQELLKAAADETTMSDLLFTWQGPGLCAVTYSLAPQVPATGPGDARGPGALAGWMESQS